MRIIHAVKIFSAVLLVSGVFALLMPVAAADFTGLQIEPGSANGRVEIAANFGGIPIALGAMGLFATLLYPPSAAAMLAAVGWIFTAAAVARILVVFFSGLSTLSIVGWVMVGFDVAAAAVFLLGSRAIENPDL
jgi:hypothetical protein